MRMNIVFEFGKKFFFYFEASYRKCTKFLVNYQWKCSYMVLSFK